MGFFTQVVVQVRDLYGKLTFSQKMAFVLLVTVVVGALVVFTSWGARGEYVPVTREPLGAKRSEVVSALDTAGIRYREAAGTLEVASAQYYDAVAVLAMHGVVPTDQMRIRIDDVS
jgi:flagellar biosynthesis/type III secretory pathway M-ring protein FliF/YscJ